MRRVCSTLLVLCLMPGAAAAAPGEPVSVHATLRWHDWQEQYGGSTQKMESLTEQGLLFALGATLPVDLLPAPTNRGTLVFRGSGELFGGQVRYDGHRTDEAGDLAQHKTDVVYLGVRGGADLGWRVPRGALSLEPFAGLDARWWLRSLQGSGGYKEYWVVLGGRLGGRVAWAVRETTTVAAAGGALLPFATYNIANGTTLRPEGQWSSFAELSLATGRWEHALFYEGLRYGKSATVRVGSTSGLFQPPSQSDVFGYRLGLRF